MLPAIPSVNRNETNETSQMAMARRCSQRKLTSTVLSNESPKVTESLSKRMPKKREGFRWLVEEEEIQNEENCDEAEKTEEVKAVALKRGKRTLNSEKLGPRSVKVLRRSQAQGSADVLNNKVSSKIRLPLVKINTKTS